MAKESIARLRFSEIRSGQKKGRKYLLSHEVYERFLATFHDLNPMHVDDAFARKSGFKAKLMHGAILNGFISHFIGMCFPGKHSLLQSVNIQYRSPAYLRETVLLQCRVEHRSAATRTLSLNIACLEAKSKRLLATAKVQVRVSA